MKADLANFTRDDLEAAFLATGITLEFGCKVWNGARRPTGYPLMRCQGVTLSAHRVACFLEHGLPEEGQDACHRCDNPPCVYGEHLFWGSRSANMSDASAKKRLWLQQHPENVPTGFSHPRARLTEAQLSEIVLGTLGCRPLARKIGYNEANIRAIRKGKLWKKEADHLRRTQKEQP